MKGQIKKVLIILFAVLFIATMTASAVNAEEAPRCGNELHEWPPHLHPHKLPPGPDLDKRIDRINEQRIDSIGS
jgi:hypothetical protein